MKRSGNRIAQSTAVVSIAVTALAAGTVSVQAQTPMHRSSAVQTLNLYTQLGGPAAGTNLNIYTNVLIPMFEKSHPDIKIDTTFGGSADSAVLARILASIKAGQPSPYDLVDPDDIMTPLEELHDGVDLTERHIPLLREINPQWLNQSLHQGMPFRGSWVILAYNSHEVKDPPHTLSQLIAWIKANPGKFTYCSPTTGGSGDAFVTTVVNSMIPAGQRPFFVHGYAAAKESLWTPGLNLLKSLGPDMYRGGYYPNGNLPINQLLSSGAIWMAPQWSDIATSSLRVGALPPYIKLAQPLPAFNGGPADIVIPKNSAHIQAAETFMNWLLTPSAQEAIVHIMGGFPGVEYRYMPPAVQKKFQTIAQHAPSPWFSQNFENDLGNKWQSAVAQAHG